MADEKSDKDGELAGKKGRSGAGKTSALALVLPALFAGGAAFGGVKVSAMHLVPAGTASAEHAAATLPPPGPTVLLEPFIVVTQDINKKSHAMKVTIAIEFNENAKEETLKSFTPRIRDAALGYLRVVAYEDALDSTKSDKLRADILERVRAAGATAADRILITDLVVQ